MAIANEELYLRTKQLFAGYQNNNLTTVQEFVLYVFEGNPNPIFQTLTVTAHTQLNGTLTVVGPPTFEDTIIAERSVQISLGLSVGDTAEIEQRTLIGTQLSSGIVADFGTGDKRHISVSQATPGTELWLLNENNGGSLIIGAGPVGGATGTGKTLVGLPGEMLGFFSTSAAQTKQTMTAAAPADLAEAIDQITTIKNILEGYGLIELA